MYKVIGEVHIEYTLRLGSTPVRKLNYSYFSPDENMFFIGTPSETRKRFFSYVFLMKMTRLGFKNYHAQLVKLFNSQL